MDFFIKETNVRGGNRGGKNLFNWDDIRLLPNRERQSYLGATQALGLMDRGGKWYRRDWWTNYNSQVNVYGHKDKLNNRSALLEEQKEIRQKEKEKLYEFIYGKKKKNNNLNIGFNDGESVKEKLDQIELDNKSIKSGFSKFSRPGLGMKNQINPNDQPIILRKDEKDEDKYSYKNKKSNNNEIKLKEENNKEREKERHSHHHRHHHHKHHHNNKSRSRGKRSRSRNRDDKIK